MSLNFWGAYSLHTIVNFFNLIAAAIRENIFYDIYTSKRI